MKLGKFLLLLNGAMFVIFGIGFILLPEFSARLLIGAAPVTQSAVIDMRATYGGTTLGIGIFFGICGLRISRIPLGVVALAWVLGSIALGRLVGFALNSEPNAMMFVALILEVALFALAVVALVQVRREIGFAVANEISRERFMEDRGTSAPPNSNEKH